MKIKLNANIENSEADEELRRLIVNENTFDNPIFISNEEQGRWNGGTEPTIRTYKRGDDGRLILPRGYARTLLLHCKDQEINPEIVDERVTTPLSFPPGLKGVELRPYQNRCIEAAMKYDQGLVVVPTGGGKTLIALELIRLRRQKAMVIVHRRELLKQWCAVIEERLGLKAGVIGEGEFDIGAEISVAMVQTLNSCSDETKKIVNDFGLIILDEAHHAPASTFFDVIAQFPAKYRYGVSATPTRRDSLEMLIFYSIGPILQEVTRREVESVGAVVPAKILVLDTKFKPKSCNSWHEYMSMLSANGERNKFIVDLVCKDDKPVLILSDRVSHVELISEFLNKRGIVHVVAHGSLKDRDDIVQRMKECRMTVATVGLLGEGVDISHWEKVILASPFFFRSEANSSDW